jgi:hypothetical protein
MADEKDEKFEVSDAPAGTAGGGAATAEKPTRDQLKEKGWSAKEMDSAEKHGMVISPEEKKKSDDAAAAKAKAESDLKAKEEAEKNKGGAGGEGGEGGEGSKKKPSSSLPDFTFKTPEQEKAFLEAFGAGTPQRAMYFRMKNERAARQASDKRATDAEAKAKSYEERIAKLEAGGGKAEPEVDPETGEVIDPENKPLTLKQLKALQQQEADENKKKEAELQERHKVVSEAQTTQEEYARSQYKDFDSTVELAKDLIQNLDALVPEKWKQTKILHLVRNLQVAAVNADKIDLDEYHAAQISYELGQLHPKYGEKPDGDEGSDDGIDPDKDGKDDDPSKANGGRKLTPEEMKRLETNTQRRTSSAAVKGGNGKKTVTAAEVDLAMLNKMKYAERQRFKEKYPDHYTRLMRG